MRRECFIGRGSAPGTGDDSLHGSISLQDAPSVLDWETWRAIDAHGLGAMQLTLATLVEEGLIADQPVVPLAHLLLGALSEAGLMIAQADDPRAARQAIGEAVDRLFQSLRLAPDTREA